MPLRTILVSSPQSKCTSCCQKLNFVPTESSRLTGGCCLTKVDLYNGCKTVVIVVYYMAELYVVALWMLSRRLHEVCVKWNLRTCPHGECGTPSSVQVNRALHSTVPSLASHTERIPLSVASSVSHSWLDNGRLLRLSESESPSAQLLWRSQWRRSVPVIVSGCHHHLDPSLWHPSAFLAEFGKVTNDVVDCGNGVVLCQYSMREFWAGFECIGSRLRDRYGCTRILKLKDWPPGDDFADLLPDRFADVMRALPFPDYTHRSGSLNLVSCLPEHFVRPDLGPKMYVAYGSALYPDVGSTNLHLDISDAVNIMMYVGIPTDDITKRHETGEIPAIFASVIIF